MNTIGIFGGTTAQQDLAYSVVQFCINRLMPRMKTLDICVDLSDDMENADGYCLAVDKREFAIEIDSNLRDDDFITALCHELVHVKQYAKGQLDINGKLSYKTAEDYLNAWYEIEAYEMQEVLLEEFKNVSQNL